jgi:hypothetical protein
MRTSGKKRAMVLGCAAAVLTLFGICAGARFWAATPRVRLADLEGSIQASLPLGTGKDAVVAWLRARSMCPQFHKDEAGCLLIETWIPDSGPPADLFWIKDILVEFGFDEHERLVRYSVKEEDRF